jgi:hypothetical protein
LLHIGSVMFRESSPVASQSNPGTFYKLGVRLPVPKSLKAPRIITSYLASLYELNVIKGKATPPQMQHQQPFKRFPLLRVRNLRRWDMVCYQSVDKHRYESMIMMWSYLPSFANGTHFRLKVSWLHNNFYSWPSNIWIRTLQRPVLLMFTTIRRSVILFIGIMPGAGDNSAVSSVPAQWMSSIVILSAFQVSQIWLAAFASVSSSFNACCFNNKH